MASKPGQVSLDRTKMTDLPELESKGITAGDRTTGSVQSGPENLDRTNVAVQYSQDRTARTGSHKRTAKRWSACMERVFINVFARQKRLVQNLYF